MRYFILCILFFSSTLFAAKKFEVVDLTFHTSSKITGINDKGEVCGVYTDKDPNEYGIFIWTPEEGFKDLGIKAYNSDDGWSSPPPAKINNLSEVVGTCKSKSVKHGNEVFRWTKEKGIEKLGFFEGNNYGPEVSAINNLGQMIIQKSSGEYSLYDNGKCIPLPQFFRYYKVFLNDRSEIFGTKGCNIDESSYYSEICYYNFKTKEHIETSHPYLEMAAFTNKGKGIGCIDPNSPVPDGATWTKAASLKVLRPNLRPICANDDLIFAHHYLLVTNTGHVTHVQQHLISQNKEIIPSSDISLDMTAINNHGQLAGRVYFKGAWRAAILNPILVE